MRGHYSVQYRDYLNLGVAGKEFPEKDDRVQPGEEAGGKSIQVMDGRELEVFEDQNKGHLSRPSV